MVEDTIARPQHLEALERANRLRILRAVLFRLAHGQPSRRDAFRFVADVLEWEPSDVVDGIVVFELVRRCFQSGPATTRRLLLRAGVSETCRVGGLTVRQRTRLCELLREGG